MLLVVGGVMVGGVMVCGQWLRVWQCYREWNGLVVGVGKWWNGDMSNLVMMSMGMRMGMEEW